MTFSIRTFLIVIAVLSVWLGALVSRSPLFVELAAGGTVLLILLSLALAIWEPRPLLRAFWTGFFALGFGNLLYNGVFNSYQQTSNQVAQVIMGNQQQPRWVPAPAYPTTRPSFLTPPSVNSFYYPDDVSADTPPSLATRDPDPNAALEEASESELSPNSISPPPSVISNPSTFAPPAMPPATYIQMPAPYADNYYEQLHAIRVSVPSLLSLLMGVVGGCVTMWIAAKRKDDEVSAKVA